MVAQLRDMHSRLIEGRPLSSGQVQLLVDGIGGFLEALDDGGPASLDRSMGIKTWGGISAVRQDAQSRRDDAIRRLWRNHAEWRDLQPYAAARLMQMDAERYELLRWPRERELFSAPAAEPAATWWQLLSSGTRIPRTKRLQQILTMEIQVRV